MFNAAPPSLPDEATIAQMDPAALRALLQQYCDHDARRQHEIVCRDARIDKLNFEIAQLKRLQYGRRSERFSGEQKALFDEAIEADNAAVEAQIEELRATLPPPATEPKSPPKRRPGRPRKEAAVSLHG